MAFEGTCHCGQVTFAVDADLPTQAMSCNCSYCRRKGMLLAFFPADKFALTNGEAALKSYMFNKYKIDHRICANCGTEPFAYGAMPDGTPIRAINVRCVAAVDLDALEIRHFDGASA